MTDNNQQIDINEKIEINQKPSVSRRTLIKGAAAVPVVLTLRSGAAYAVSSIQSCVERDNLQAGSENPEVMLIPTDGIPFHDGWVRKEVVCRTLIELDKSKLPEQVAAEPRNEFNVWIDTTDTDQSTSASWAHEMNIPSEDSTGHRSFKIATILNPLDGFMVEETLDMDDQVPYAYTVVSLCRILVHIDENTHVKILPVDNFPIGYSELGASRPYIMRSCWTSINPTGTMPINL